VCVIVTTAAACVHGTSMGRRSTEYLSLSVQWHCICQRLCMVCAVHTNINMIILLIEYYRFDKNDDHDS
jgi:hypothetical protein